MKVSVLIVNFRSTKLLERCLASLARSRGVKLEVIVVDNASPDFDCDRMRAEWSWVRFLPQQLNTTFTGGNNLAFAASSGGLVLLLNPDTEVAVDAIANAVELIAEKKIAAVGADLVDPDGRPQRYYRRLPTVGDIPVVLFPRLLRWTSRGRRYLLTNVVIGERTTVDQPPGAFLLFRRDDVGEPPLDARYLNFLSDVDLCRRLRRHGLIVVSNRVLCTHVRGAAGVRTRDAREQLRLWHDLSWGIGVYFATSGSWGRAYLTAWLWIFWVVRVLQIGVTRPAALQLALRTARVALSGSPPRFGAIAPHEIDGDGAMAMKSGGSL